MGRKLMPLIPQGKFRIYTEKDMQFETEWYNRNIDSFVEMSAAMTNWLMTVTVIEERLNYGNPDDYHKILEGLDSTLLTEFGEIEKAFRLYMNVPERTSDQIAGMRQRLTFFSQWTRDLREGVIQAVQNTDRGVYLRGVLGVEMLPTKEIAGLIREVSRGRGPTDFNTIAGVLLAIQKQNADKAKKKVDWYESAQSVLAMLDRLPLSDPDRIDIRNRLTGTHEAVRIEANRLFITFSRRKKR